MTVLSFVLPFLIMGVMFSVAFVVLRQVLWFRSASAKSWAEVAHRLRLGHVPAGFLRSPRIEGKFQGMKVLVDVHTEGSGQHSRTYTRARAFFPRPLRLGLKLGREGGFHKLMRFIGIQDVQIGDEEFDRDVRVESRDPEELRRFLTRVRRIRVLHFLRAHSRALIDDRSVGYSMPGRVRSQEVLQGSIQTVVRMAASLLEQPEEDGRMEAVLDARAEGDADRAVALLREAVSSRPPPPPPPEARARSAPEPLRPPPPPPAEEAVMLGEMLVLAGKDAEAKQAFEQAVHTDPEDPEAREWLERFVDTKDGAVVFELPGAPAPEVGGERPGPESAASPVSDLDLEEMARRLFLEASSGLAAEGIFRQHYEGRAVRWKGTLTKATPTPFDFVFGDRPFTKATVELHDLPEGVYGQRLVKAILRLPEDQLAAAQGAVGGVVVLEGVLRKVDGLMRLLYVDEARLTPEG